MSTNAKIRTMQDDIEEAKNAKKNQVESNKSETTSKSSETKDAVIQDVDTQNVESLKQEENNITEKQKIEEKIVSSVPKPSIEFSNKINDAQSNEIKDLIKRISREKDKDPIKKPEENQSLIEKKEEEIIPTKADEKIKPIIKSAETEKNGNSNENDIEALKNLISRISQPPIEKEEPEKKSLTKEPKEDDSQKEISDLVSQIKPDEKKETFEIKPKLTKKTDEIISQTLLEKEDPKENVSTLISQIKPDEKKETSEIKPIQEKQPNQKAETKKSFWGNISKNIKTTSDSQKINDLSVKDSISKKPMTEEKLQSGILHSKKKDDKNEEKQNKLLKTYYTEDYVPPIQRLSSGKQELYSSVSKKIKPKEDKNEIEAMKNTNEIKGKEKIITKDEEYKKLKKNIIQKYNVKFFSLPWKKIIVITVFILILVGGGYTLLYKTFIPNQTQKPPVASVPAVFGSEIEEFSNIEKELTIAKKDIRGISELSELVEINAEAIFSSNQNVKIIKLFIVDNNTDKNILPLKEALDTIAIIDITNDKNNLPEGFLDLTTNNYNLFIFETNKEIRYGLAIKTNNTSSLSFIMEKWKKETTPNKKLAMVFKPLFLDSANHENQWKQFSQANYEEIQINYVHLIDSDTALNYFIYNDILVFTTSKDNTFTMADLLLQKK
ncbi:MAG: hypothetical protein P1P85_02515 [Patescibacteria group bacterium]|nr:hypothetical protein [Patescibacteria group bacterium]